MLKNISSVKLLGILGALVLVYLGFEFFGGKSRSKSFKENIVEIDTIKVTKVVIDSKGESLELLKEGSGWKVSIGSGKYAEALGASVKSTLNSLMTVKPSRIATKDPEKWKDYQVDSSGTRVQVYEGDKNTLDLVIGRFGFNQEAMQRQQQMGGRGGMNQFYTYVRLEDDKEVYVADNFMGMSLSAEASGYRNRQLLSITTDSLSEIRLDYPGDSSYVMAKVDSLWMIAGVLTDSAATASYLGGIRYVNSSNFVDDVPADALVSPTYTLTLKQTSKPDIVVKAFQHPVYKWIINSSENPASYFADPKIVDEMFIGKGQLLEKTN